MTIDDETSAPQPERGNRWCRWRRLSIRAVQALAALAIIVWLADRQLSFNDKRAPLIEPGVLGESNHNFKYRVRVGTDYALARSYRVTETPHQPPRLVRTQGIWLAIPAEFEATSSRQSFDASLISHDGLNYAAERQRLNLSSVNLAGRHGDPGLVERGMLFFELPPDRLRGARLIVHSGMASLSSGMDSMFEIDLDIDARRAEELLAGAAALQDLPP